MTTSNQGFGSRPKPDSPEWFEFSRLPSPTWWNYLADWLTDPLVDVPSTPQNTADFCSVPPPSDLPTAADYVSAAFPVAAFLSGAYRRFGNARKADAWSQLCEWKPDPNAPPSPGPPVTPGAICGPVGGQRGVWFNADIPPGTKEVWLYHDAYTVNGVATAFPDSQFDVSWGTAPKAVGDNLTLGRNWLHWRSFNNPLIIAWSGYFNCDVGGQFSIANGITGWDDTMCLTLRYAFVPCEAPGDPEPPPTVPPPPSGYPAPSGGEICGSLDDVCGKIADVARSVDTANQMLRYLASLVVPPQATPDPVPTPVASGEPIARPSSALGVSVTFTVPAELSHWGSSPVAYGGAGWVTPVTAWGFVQSQPLRHSPLVIHPLPVATTDVLLDLAPGVTAELQWLSAPK